MNKLIVLAKPRTRYLFIFFPNSQGSNLLRKMILILENSQKILNNKNKFSFIRKLERLYSETKKPIITYNRLLLNLKLKKEKKIKIFKESMLTPKYNKKAKIPQSLQKSSKKLCCTDRRMEYSIKLSKKLKNSKKNLQSPDIQGFIPNSKQISITTFQSFLIKPLSRLFFSIFQVKKPSKSREFSFLTKTSKFYLS